MTREELLRSKEYWTADIRQKMFEVLATYMKENNLNQKELAEKLGVSEPRITYLLNRDRNHTVFKLVELAMFAGKIPIIKFVDIDKYIKADEKKWKAKK